MKTQTSKEFLSNHGYGNGTNFTLGIVADLMDSYANNKSEIAFNNGKMFMQDSIIDEACDNLGITNPAFISELKKDEELIKTAYSITDLREILIQKKSEITILKKLIKEQEVQDQKEMDCRNNAN
jgi:hypothetical protein